MDTKCQLEANGLKLIELHSSADPFEVIDKTKLNDILANNFAQKSFAVVWLDYKVLVGTWENGDFHFYNNAKFEHKYIQRLRVFDQEKELLAWRSNGNLKGRLRKDDWAGSGTEIVVAEQTLFGTKKGTQSDAKYTEITEDRGTSLVLPFTNLRTYKDKKDKVEKLVSRIAIKTHNYIKPNAVHQMSYFDCRFVAFTDREKTLS